MLTPADVDLPVALFLHQRPEFLARQLSEIDTLRPTRIYAYIDGDVTGNGPGVRERKEILEYLEAGTPNRTPIDIRPWGHQLGIQGSIFRGLSEVFKDHEFAIVLEDDCLPSPTFGNFVRFARKVQELGDIAEIGTVSCNYFGPQFSKPHLSRFPRTWGWATSRGVWAGFNPTRQVSENVLNDALHWAFRSDPFAATRRAHWSKRYLDSVLDKNMWDAQWTIHNWSRHAFSLSPGRNLVTNIGRDAKATHSHDDRFFVGKVVSTRHSYRFEMTERHGWMKDQAELAFFNYAAFVSASSRRFRGKHR